jgi:hypothetical protein
VFSKEFNLLPYTNMSFPNVKLLAPLAVVIVVSSAVLYALQLDRDPIIVNGFKVKEFEKNHPGTYAMGDRAGIVGYLASSPVVQLEGLVMDKNFLDKLKHSKKLIDLLQSYKVDYYITYSNSTKEIGNSAFIVSEPFQSHGFSPKIVDTISWPVSYRFSIEEKYNKKAALSTETIIFKVPKE